MPSNDFVVARMRDMTEKQRVVYLQELIGHVTSDVAELNRRAHLLTALREAHLRPWATELGF